MDSMGSNVSVNMYPRFEKICLDREVVRTALVAMSVMRFDGYTEPT